MPFSVLLVDDHKIMRDGIKAILQGSDEFHVVAEAESGSEAVQICKKQRPDIVLMGLALPGLNGIETTGELLRFHPGIKIIILSMYDDEHSVVGAVRSGARAFVVKRASEGDLLDALRTVAKGGSYLSPQVSDRLLHHVRRGDLDSTKPSRPPSTCFRPANSRFCASSQKAKAARKSRFYSMLVCSCPNLPQNNDEETRRKQHRRSHAVSACIWYRSFPDARRFWIKLGNT